MIDDWTLIPFHFKMGGKSQDREGFNEMMITFFSAWFPTPARRWVDLSVGQHLILAAARRGLAGLGGIDTLDLFICFDVSCPHAPLR